MTQKTKSKKKGRLKRLKMWFKKKSYLISKCQEIYEQSIKQKQQIEKLKKGLKYDIKQLKQGKVYWIKIEDIEDGKHIKEVLEDLPWTAPQIILSIRDIKEVDLDGIKKTKQKNTRKNTRKKEI